MNVEKKVVEVRSEDGFLEAQHRYVVQMAVGEEVTWGDIAKQINTFKLSTDAIELAPGESQSRVSLENNRAVRIVAGQQDKEKGLPVLEEDGALYMLINQVYKVINRGENGQDSYPTETVEFSTKVGGEIVIFPLHKPEPAGEAA